MCKHYTYNYICHAFILMASVGHVILQNMIAANFVFTTGIIKTKLNPNIVKSELFNFPVSLVICNRLEEQNNMAQVQSLSYGSQYSRKRMFYCLLSSVMSPQEEINFYRMILFRWQKRSNNGLLSLKMLQHWIKS